MEVRDRCGYGPFGVSFEGVTRLSRGDLEGVLRFVNVAGDLEFEELYPIELLARLRELIRCDAITYAELDRSAQVHFAGVGLPEDVEDDVDVYWNVVCSCPTFEYRDRTGDLHAVRVLDLISRRRYHQLPIYRDYFLPYGLDDYVELALRAQPGRDRFFVLFRCPGATDFSERDRDVLELLRTHLCRFEVQAELRRQLVDASRASRFDEELHARLTRREREIAALVADGKTNAEIAAALWVAPGTVKKHLDNIYAKIGVGRRAAAAAVSATASRGPV
jgi:DNA-binding CsgD family transcriptional regulator